MSKKLIIAIDGPAGAGKSTIAKMLAHDLGYIYIDTGAMYRTVTYKAMKLNLDISDDYALWTMAVNTDILLKNDGGVSKVFCDGEDVSQKIRTEKITANVNRIAEIKEIREILRDKQRRLGAEGNVVMEGRDIGTVVFPNADIKFFLDADVSERATRRYKELKEKNENPKLEDINEAIIRRDSLDRSRGISPLKCAEDAIVVNSTSMTPGEVVDFMLEKVREK